MMAVLLLCVAVLFPGITVAAGNCVDQVAPYLSHVNTMGQHVVCVQTPWRASGEQIPSEVVASVFYDGLAGVEGHTYRLRTGDASNSVSAAVEQLLARLTARRLGAEALGADWLQANSHISTALFDTAGHPVLEDNALYGQSSVPAQNHVIFAFDGGRWLWPPIRIGHVWNISLPSKQKLQLRTLSLRPAVFSMEGFLSAEEAALIQQTAAPSLARSGVANTDGSGKDSADVRTSSNTFISRGSSQEITELERRVHALTRTWYNEGEHIQVVKYTKHQMYEAHWDYFNPEQYTNQPDVIERMDLWKRNRLATVFWYLNTLPDGAGGETFFPRALDGHGESITPWRYDYKSCNQGIKYPPTAGHALLFYSMRPDGQLEEHSMHGGVREASLFLFDMPQLRQAPSFPFLVSAATHATAYALLVKYLKPRPTCCSARCLRKDLRSGERTSGFGARTSSQCSIHSSGS